MKNPFVPLLLSLLLSLPVLAQNPKTPEKANKHHEIPDKHSVYMPLENYETSAAYEYEGVNIFFTQVNINAEGENILGDAANEPSIAVDPNNPDRIMIGWRQFDNINSSFRQAGHAYSLDGGHTWTYPGNIDEGVFRSDPVLDCDPDGNFYYNSLTVTSSDDFYCTVFKTLDEDVAWDEGTDAQGGDKQWMVIDKSESDGSGNNYSFWTKYYSICYPDYFTRSTNLGYSYEPCSAIPGEPYWGTLAVGPEGELYVAGTSEYHDVMVTVSFDAKIPNSDVSWTVFSNVDLDGSPTAWTEVNPKGLMGQVYVDVDVSNGPGNGYAYVVASVDRNSTTDPGDVMFARSTDGGLTWEAPVRINDDASETNYQWFGTMSVAPNGRIDVVWLDTRVDIWGLYNSALFYSFSEDQGQSWSVNVQLSEQFDPHVGWPQQEKMGDYFDMVSDNGGAHLAWANTLNGEQDVYYAYITPHYVGVDEINPGREFVEISNYPNPFTSRTSIQYTIPADSHVSIAVYDLFGKKLDEVIDGPMPAGTHSIDYSTDALAPGVYFAKLVTAGKTESIRMIKL